MDAALDTKDHASDARVRAILIHGMGRTPLSMLILAARLRADGLQPVLFGYSAAFERWPPCVARLHHFLARNSQAQRYVVIGHSLGCLLTLAALPGLAQPPEACFFGSANASQPDGAHFFTLAFVQIDDRRNRPISWATGMDQPVARSYRTLDNLRRKCRASRSLVTVSGRNQRRHPDRRGDPIRRDSFGRCPVLAYYNHEFPPRL